MTAFRLSDFPDPPEGATGFANDVDYPLNQVTTGTVVAVKAKPEKQSISVKIVKEIDGSSQYAIWHNLNLGGEYGYIGKQQLVALYGDANLVPATNYDDVAEGLKGVEVEFKAVPKGDFVNVKSLKVKKSVKDIKGSTGLGELVSAPAPTQEAAPAAAAAPTPAPAPASSEDPF